MKNTDTEAISPDISDEIQSQPKNEWENQRKTLSIIHHPWLPWILIGCLLLALIVIIWKYEYTERSHYGIHRSWPYMQVYPINPWAHWEYWDREMESHRKEIQKTFERIESEQESLLREYKKSPFSWNTTGKYTGTRIIDTDTFTYSLDISEKNLTGVISGTNSKNLESIKKNVESLGYKIEKRENGYVFSGVRWNEEKLWDIFWR